MSFSTQPSRRTLVKGAAWSVPVVVAGHQAPAMAASPCNIKLTVSCVNGVLTFSWARISGELPQSITFTLTISGDTQGDAGSVVTGTNVEGPKTPANGSIYTLTPGSATSGTVIAISRSSNQGSRTYTLTTGSSGPCMATATGSIVGTGCPA